MKTLNLICPVSNRKTNETTIRIIAFITLLLILISVYTSNFFLSLFLLIDFSLRGFLNGKGSLLKLTAQKIVKHFNLKTKTINAAPKEFAAKIGFAFTLLILFSQVANYNTLAFIFGGVMIFCTLLESIFSVCLGCYFYSFLSRYNVLKIFNLEYIRKK